MYLLASIAIAIAPGIALSLFIYFRDKYDKEPIKLLLLCFILGAFSIYPGIICEDFLWDLRIMHVSPFMKAFVGTAVVEEYWKLFFILIIPFRHKAFNEPFDGIVYAVMVSMGFATAENILYVLKGGIGLGVMRMFTAVPAHASFAVVMGFLLGEAKFLKKYNFLMVMLAWLAATLMHGLYDYCLFKESIPGLWIGAFLSLFIGIILSFIAIRIHRNKSKKVFLKKQSDQKSLDDFS